MDVACDSEAKHQLPQIRMPERRYPDTPPWKERKIPTIKTTLLDTAVSKETATSFLRTSALETIDSYPRTTIQAYTDGSAFKGTTFAGFGVLLKYPDGTSFEYSDACGNKCSNYEAEIAALNTTAELLHQQFELGEKDPAHIVIFSDSKSAL